MALKFKPAVANVNGKQETIKEPEAPKASPDPSKALTDANVKTTFGTPADTK